MRQWHEISDDDFVTLEEFTNHYSFMLTTPRGGWHWAYIIHSEFFDDRYKKNFVQPRHVRDLAWIDVCSIYDYIEESFPFLHRSQHNYDNENIQKRFLEFYDEGSYVWFKTTSENQRIKIHSSGDSTFLSIKVVEALEFELDEDEKVELSPNRLDEKTFRHVQSPWLHTKSQYHTFKRPGTYRVRFVHTCSMTSDSWTTWNHYNLFNSCPALVRVESDFFKQGHEWFRRHPNLDLTFRNCYGLVTVDDNIVGEKAKPWVTNMAYMFANCYNLEKIDPYLFRGCSRLYTVSCCYVEVKRPLENPIVISDENIERMFEGCANLVTIDSVFSQSGFRFKLSSETLKPMPNLSNISWAFSGCQTYGDLPVDMFANNPNLRDASRFLANNKFINYTNEDIQIIPEDLFKHNPNLELVEGFFVGNWSGWSKNLVVPGGLFRHNPKLRVVTSLFWCNSGTEYTRWSNIPEDIFDHNPALENAWGCFSGCAINFKPKRYLWDKPNLVQVERMFAYTLTTDVPDNLFEYNPKITHVNHMFEECPYLSSVGTNIFNEQHTNLGHITGMFADSGKQGDGISIASNLINNVPNLNTIQSLFLRCKIKSIGTNIYSDNPKLVNCRWNFERAEGEFEVDFNQWYRGCKNITDMTNEFNTTSALRRIINLNEMFQGGDVATESTPNILMPSYFSVCDNAEVVGNVVAKRFIDPIRTKLKNIDRFMMKIGLKVYTTPENFLIFEDSLFEDCTNLVDIRGAFWAIGYARFGNKFFKNCTSLTTATYLFGGAGSQTHAWFNLGYENKILSFGHSFFSGCEKLVDISSVFEGSVVCESFDFGSTEEEGVFYGCNSLFDIRRAFSGMGYRLPEDKRHAVTMPGNLFNAQAKANIRHAECFMMYSALFESVGDSLMEGCTRLLSVNDFAYYSRCKSFGNNIFKDCTALTSAFAAFGAERGGGSHRRYTNNRLEDLKSIGTGLFSGCISLQNCTSLFEAQHRLSTIGGIELDAMTDPDAPFYNCTSINTMWKAFFETGWNIPEEEKNHYWLRRRAIEPFAANLLNANLTFARCGLFFVIDDGLFENCTKMTEARSTFWHMKIYQAGNRLFKGCTNLRLATDIFSGDGGDSHRFNNTWNQTLERVGHSLFSGCTNLVEAWGIFDGCVKLRHINWGSTDEESMFYNCTSLKYIQRMFMYFGYSLDSVGKNFARQEFKNDLFKWSPNIIKAYFAFTYGVSPYDVHKPGTNTPWRTVPYEQNVNFETHVRLWWYSDLPEDIKQSTDSRYIER